MNEKQLREQWLQDEKISFQGWDFSYLNKRWKHEKIPWDYGKIVHRYLKNDMQLLDMGTGGGEFLLSLHHPYDKTSVTEAWQPNVDLCVKKLKPLGISVRQIFNDFCIPYDDNNFDFVINRHEAYDLDEVKRILKTNGLFISQQVGGYNNRPLSERLIPNFTPLYPDFDLKNEAIKWEKAGFEVIYKDECFSKLFFYDVGAIVYFAKVIEWEFPNFSVETNFQQLIELQKLLEVNGYIESIEHRFIIVLRNIQ
ncbi:MAG: SAM-dependent methyltransferase [Firmicutes bacterium HGW-Firmicutes-1]|jgi:SAM-dependent methyltransferase|nr:MAG: SAM-dependent methyltransferase [Firmicutes bacterium HGW-Firmicutes-1]